MFNSQGKNVVIVGGFRGIGFSLVKACLMKGCNTLLIVDVTCNESILESLRQQYSYCKIYYQELAYDCNIYNLAQSIKSKLPSIDVFINAFEIVFEKDLLKTMYTNMDIYLNLTYAIRKFMDVSEGGCGGLILNVLSNLGAQKMWSSAGFDYSLYFINKQMLMCWSKAISKDFYYEKTGVSILTCLPVVNKTIFFKNLDYINQYLPIGQDIKQRWGLVESYYPQGPFEGQGSWESFNPEYKYYADREYYPERESYPRRNYSYKHGHNSSYNFQEMRYAVEGLYGPGYECDYEKYGMEPEWKKSMDLVAQNILKAIKPSMNGVLITAGVSGVILMKNQQIFKRY